MGALRSDREQAKGGRWSSGMRLVIAGCGTLIRRMWMSGVRSARTVGGRRGAADQAWLTKAAEVAVAPAKFGDRSREIAGGKIRP